MMRKSTSAPQMLQLILRARSRESGSGDVGMLFQVMILCVALSVGIIVLSWIKSVKDARSAPKQVDMLTSAGRGYGYAITYFPGICGSDECSSFTD